VTVYATPGQLRIALTRDPQHPEGTAAELSDEALQQSIDAAQAQIDVRLAGRYTVPFVDPIPELITPIAIAIATYLADLGYRQSVDATAQDPVARRYQWATDLLTRLAAGGADLPGYSTAAGVFPINPSDGEMFALADFALTDSAYAPWPYGFSDGGRW
jgi:phage gp36-like protein